MANTIALAKKYVPLLDAVYQQNAKTAILESDASLARAGQNANEIIIPKLSMDGLGDYSRANGYVAGDVTLAWETVQFNYERGRMFNVDAMDNEETAGIAFGMLASEFIRTKVVPEIDAFRFATYAGISGISKVSAGATLADGDDVIAALRAATNTMDEDEVTEESRHLFITPTLLGYIQDMDSTKSREVLSGFASITTVPQTRFYTSITLLDGSTTGEESGGYEKTRVVYTLTSDTKFVAGKNYYTVSDGVYSKATVTTGENVTPSTYYEMTQAPGADINFMIIEKSAILQFTKHAVPKIISPDVNQTADGWKFGYRNYGLADVYENKVKGIYLHHKA